MKNLTSKTRITLLGCITAIAIILTQIPILKAAQLLEKEPTEKTKNKIKADKNKKANKQEEKQIRKKLQQKGILLLFF